jgi:Ca2+:H+ antiporter
MKPMTVMTRILLALLVFVPISLILKLTHAAPTWVFVASGLAIVPLAGFMSQATEELAKHLGATVGGLLNATFGNATELIITLLAVQAGQLDVVRASIIGSIIGNILLVLGLAIFVGGLKYKAQKFNEDAASTQSVMLILAVVTLLLPSLFVHALPPDEAKVAGGRVAGFSLWVAGLLIVLYVSNLLFSLVTHREQFCDPHAGMEEEKPNWSKRVAITVLACATLAVALESELLVGSIESTVQAWGLSKLFVGVIIVPIIGNAAEHATAVIMALKNRMDVSLNICVSSSTQIALFVAPLIVFVSIPLGHPLKLVFNNFEIIAVGFAAWIAALIARDGDSNWFEGAQLLIVYAILALAFYFVPP